MDLRVLYCPNCGAPVTPIDGLDTFYCSYCGYKIQMTGISNASYRARTKIKRMEHKERMRDKKDEHDLAEKELQMKKDKQDYIILGIMFVSLVVLMGILAIFA